MSDNALTTPEKRIITVDALRGFALFGILYSHMIFWYTAGPLPEEIYTGNNSIASGIAMGIYGVLFFSKFFSFFSFLFGLSFYIQMKSLSKRNDNFVLRYGWRLFILGIIGLIHHALWRGDILSIYVPLGFLLLFVRNLRNKAILFIGIIFILNIPTKIYEAVTNLTQTSPPVDMTATAKEESEHFYNIVKDGSFTEMVIDNIKAFSTKFEYQIDSGRLIITFGFFLMGMYVGRMKWFENLDNLKPHVKRLWKSISFILFGIIGAAIVFAVSDRILGLKLQENAWGRWIYGFFFDIFNATLTLFYISGLTLLMYRVKWQKILFQLSPIGKMALTSYLMQTFFGLVLFYSFGLGLFLKTTPGMNALICIGIFAVQMLFSMLWLKYFTYGPIEWLWRSLTFVRWQRILRKSISGVSPQSTVDGPRR